MSTYFIAELALIQYVVGNQSKYTGYGIISLHLPAYVLEIQSFWTTVRLELTLPETMSWSSIYFMKGRNFTPNL